MKRIAFRFFMIGVIGSSLLVWVRQFAKPAQITIDYPLRGSIFPPEFLAPTFIWRDADDKSKVWVIDFAFGDGTPHIQSESLGDRMQIGEIDPRCIAPTNELPKLTAEQAASRVWTPDMETWSAIKKHSMLNWTTVTITGYRDQDLKQVVSRGQVTLQTSTDPVGAPIFYRDVPLMPSELQKGVIKPLSADALPLVGWRLRNVNEPRSHLLMEGLHTCANCHSFSTDGKTLGLDVDGPANDKGLYALVDVKPQASIRNEDVIKWSTYRGPLGGKLRVGFMSRVSPDGQIVVTMINDSGENSRNPQQELQTQYYVNNFKDYRFLQVFYPTRGILAWYSRSTGHLQPLPGADDPRYVQTNGVWSPDGKYLVFSRATAKDPYVQDEKKAEYANDPKETQIQFDLYRIPFNGGKGGRPEPVVGASNNGMSNNFPKISPDGRWIVFVQCRNGQLMRPDSQLYIVPFEGGTARRLQCNTPLMNSWHSFSPNGRWLVFSSKSRSPYTQMFLTHLDEQGHDSPAILIENSTAANRAVNIPEFVNILPDGLLKLDAPAAELYRIMDLALDLSDKKQYEAAIPEWKKALASNPSDAMIHTNLGVALAQTGKFDEAIRHFQRALELNPDDVKAHINLGAALGEKGRFREAILQCQRALQIDSKSSEAHTTLAIALAKTNKLNEAISQFEMALASANANPAPIHYYLGIALLEQGRHGEALQHLRQALDLAKQQNNPGLVTEINSTLSRL